MSNISRCSIGGLWVIALSLADTISDFIYFGEVLADDRISDAAAYAVLACAMVGLVTLMAAGPAADCALTTSLLLEDFPQVVVTTCIESYRVGADISQWERVAAVSYIFSLFALQQKVMSVVYLTKVDEVGRRRMGSGPIAQGIEWRRSEERRQDRPTCCEVFFVSLVVVTVALTLAWGIALFIILFA